MKLIEKMSIFKNLFDSNLPEVCKVNAQIHGIGRGKVVGNAIVEYASETIIEASFQLESTNLVGAIIHTQASCQSPIEWLLDRLVVVGIEWIFGAILGITEAIAYLWA